MLNNQITMEKNKHNLKHNNIDNLHVTIGRKNEAFYKSLNFIFFIIHSFQL